HNPYPDLKRLNTISSSGLLKNSRLVPTKERCASGLGRTRSRVVPGGSEARIAPPHEAKKVVEVNGIEPMTPCLQSRCPPSWAARPRLGGSGLIRTSDPRFIKTVLYPAELQTRL